MVPEQRQLPSRGQQGLAGLALGPDRRSETQGTVAQGAPTELRLRLSRAWSPSGRVFFLEVTHLVQMAQLPCPSLSVPEALMWRPS